MKHTLHTATEIVNALHVIKEECEYCEGCEQCVFYKDGCMFETERPANWNINNAPPEDWRAFK